MIDAEKGIQPRSGRFATLLSTWAVPTLCLLLILTFTTSVVDYYELPKAVLLRSLAGLSLLALGVNRHFASELVRRPIFLTAVAYLAVEALATLLSIEPLTSLFGSYLHDQGLLTTLGAFSLFVLCATLVRDGGRFRDVLSAIALGSAVASIYAILQFAGLDPAGLQPQIEDGRRTYATIGHPNTVGELLAITLPLTGWLIVRGQGLRRDLALWTAGFQLVALYLTGARAAWVVVVLEVLGLGAILLTRRIGNGERLWKPLAVAVPVVALAATGAILLAPGVASSADLLASQAALRGSPILTRQLLWPSAVELVRERPLLGWGPETFELAYPRHRSQRLDALYGNVGRDDAVHNLYLGEGVNSGLLGLAALLSWQVAVLRLLFRTALSKAPVGALSPSMAAALSLAYCAYPVLYVVGEHRVAVDWLPWLIGGCALGLSTAPRVASALPRAARWLALGLGALLLLESSTLLLGDLAAGLSRRAETRRQSSLAIAAIETAGGLRPAQPAYQRRLGRLLLDEATDIGDRGSYDRALEASRNGAELQRLQSASAVMQFAATLQASERARGVSTEEPMALAERGIALDPVNPLMRTAAAEIALRQGQPGLARTHWEAARELSHSPDAHARVGYVAGLLGDRQAARAAYRQAAGQEWRAALRPNRFEAWGDAAMAVGAPDEALFAYDEGLRMRPEDLTLRVRRGEALAALNRPAEALAEAQFVLTRQPENRRAAALIQRLGGVQR